MSCRDSSAGPQHTTVKNAKLQKKKTIQNAKIYSKNINKKIYTRPLLTFKFLISSFGKVIILLF